MNVNPTAHVKHYLDPNEGPASKKQKTDPSESSTTAVATAAIANTQTIDSFFMGMGANLTTLILSCLDIEEMSSLANVSYLTRFINGYGTQATPSSCASSASDSVYSPAVLSQIHEKTYLTYDEVKNYVDFGIPTNIIFSTIGKNLKTLKLYPQENDFDPQNVDILYRAGQYCSNIEKIQIERFETELMCEPDPFREEFIIKALKSNVKMWPNLKALHFAMLYMDILSGISTQKITSLSIDLVTEHWEYCTELFDLIGEKCPFLTSLNFGASIFESTSLAELAPKCPRLETLSFYLDEGGEPEVHNEGICAFIAKCPIHSIHLEGIVCTRSILKALLENRRQLKEASLNIGASIDNKDEQLTSELVRDFLRANRGSLHSFKVHDTCDEWFNHLLEFVTNNKILKDLKVCFGNAWADVRPISLDNLKSFVEQCAHIDSVTIGLLNFDNVPHNYVDFVRSTYPNITIDIDKDGDDPS